MCGKFVLLWCFIFSQVVQVVFFFLTHIKNTQLAPLTSTLSFDLMLSVGHSKTLLSRLKTFTNVVVYFYMFILTEKTAVIIKFSLKTGNFLFDYNSDSVSMHHVRHAPLAIVMSHYWIYLGSGFFFWRLLCQNHFIATDWWPIKVKTNRPIRHIQKIEILAFSQVVSNFIKII